MSRLAFILLVGATCSACTSDPPVVTIDVTTGHETDAFSQDPAVTEVTVKGLTVDGATLMSATAQPGGSFSLGEVAEDELLRFEVTGTDATSTLQVRGRSLGLVIGELAADVLPVFAQRLGQWARPPSQLDHSHVGGLGAVLGERLLMVTGGSATDGAEDGSVAFYDLLALGGATGGVLSFVPKSIVVSADGDAALFIDEHEAHWIDFAAAESAIVEPPDGLSSFDQIAGGKTVVGPEASYVVGATRSSAPSDRILVVAADRSLSSATLTAPRQHAAAAWVPDVGLAIAGGSDTAAGVEVLAAGGSTATLRPFEPDAVIGAGAVKGIVGGELLLLCGVDGDQPSLECIADCTPTTLDIDLGATVTHCDAYAADDGAVLVVGQDVDDGQIRTWSVAVTAAAATELPLREPRLGAVSVPAPNGTLALLGGEHLDGTPALTVEMLFP
ncbi:MAG: hypothetical protein JRI68_25490 [Deltaproteobacteria bacterium]|nr:hypothetical protein [Deltaproteobacteria bacterium]